MKCDNCGTAVPQGAGFCPVCGKRIPGYTTLVSKARQGDQQALTELYCRTSDGVYNTIRFLIKEEDTAQDVLQDTSISRSNSSEAVLSVSTACVRMPESAFPMRAMSSASNSFCIGHNFKVTFPVSLWMSL